VKTPTSSYTGPGLYLHIPFCTSICPYCDFAVLIGYQQRRAGFVEALIAEIRQHRDQPQLTYDTIYLGGGTPSSIATDQLDQVLTTIRQELSLSPDPWLYLEANPEDVTPENLRAWRALGFRTISIGVQSFDDEVLSFLGRRHRAAQASKSVELARQAGFHTVSIDLIYGFAGHEPVAWRRQLDQAIALAPDHLSCYQLTLHQKTVLGRRYQRGELVELPEPVQAELFLLTHKLLNDSGFQGYEVSNFAAAPAHHSRHNRKYWDHTPYLGLGPSAHSFDGNRRWWNLRKLRHYQAAVAAGRRPRAGEEELSAEELALEEVMLGMRTCAGVDTGRVRDRYGIDLLAANTEVVSNLAQAGLLEQHGAKLVPTIAGLAVADTIAREIVIPGGEP
jgi:oxygen-independent coproporphyrinogen-3 oxidase